MLLRQEKLGLARRRCASCARCAADDPIIRRVFLAGIRQYIRRDFHPRNNANEHLAAEWFAARGISIPEAA